MVWRRWTEDTTEGFRPDDLALINAVGRRVWGDLVATAEHPDRDIAQMAKSLDDALNNAWFEGATPAQMEAATRLSRDTAMANRDSRGNKGILRDKRLKNKAIETVY